ncbi:hypothetical protein EBZ80_25205, partial [bacterium]|nr:hypothetical protein [bacterium]
ALSTWVYSPSTISVIQPSSGTTLTWSNTPVTVSTSTSGTATTPSLTMTTGSILTNQTLIDTAISTYEPLLQQQANLILNTADAFTVTVSGGTTATVPATTLTFTIEALDPTRCNSSAAGNVTSVSALTYFDGTAFSTANYAGTTSGTIAAAPVYVAAQFTVNNNAYSIIIPITAANVKATPLAGDLYNLSISVPQTAETITGAGTFTGTVSAAAQTVTTLFSLYL